MSFSIRNKYNNIVFLFIFKHVWELIMKYNEISNVFMFIKQERIIDSFLCSDSCNCNFLLMNDFYILT